MKIVYFTHSLRSCWNHGNAHFVRGVLRELAGAGHRVRALEPENPWSVQNLVADHGQNGFAPFFEAYPELAFETYPDEPDLAALTDGADLVLVHEWNEPALVNALGELRGRGARFTLLFHDTHHRMASEPDAMRRYRLDDYDGVLAFGASLAEAYRRLGWGRRAFVWHEAADTRLFRPPAEDGERQGLVWIGNWGDDERSDELRRFLLRPAAAAGARLDIYGVRYPESALAELSRHGARHHGWLPNPRAPEVYARHLATVHVPRRLYVERLPGIPTIRVFEALACGAPLLSAPWQDSEALFEPGRDFLVASDEAGMTTHMRAVQNDPELRRELARNGLAAIQARHTCRHRAEELLGFMSELSAPQIESATA